MLLTIQATHAFTGDSLWMGSVKDPWMPCQYVQAMIAQTMGYDIAGIRCALRSGTVLKPNRPLWTYSMNGLLEVTAIFVDQTSDIDEAVEDLPLALTKHDPFLHATLCDSGVKGVVASAVAGAITKTRLYLIQYEDGDMEHVDLQRILCVASRRSTTGPLLHVDRKGVVYTKRLRHRIMFTFLFRRWIWAQPADASASLQRVLKVSRVYSERRRACLVRRRHSIGLV